MSITGTVDSQYFVPSTDTKSSQLTGSKSNSEKSPMTFSFEGHLKVNVQSALFLYGLSLLYSTNISESTGNSAKVHWPSNMGTKKKYTNYK